MGAKLQAVPNPTPGAAAKLPAVAPQLLTVAEVAALLRLKPQTIYNMVSQKRIPFRKAGTHLLFDLAEIDTWIKSSADNQ